MSIRGHYEQRACEICGTVFFVNKCIPVVQKYGPSPEQLRYSFKRVREITGIKRPVRLAPLPKFYTPAEVYTLTEGASRVSTKHRLLVDCLIQTGLRISEFHKLDLRDLDPSGHQLLVHGGKGGKDRIVPLSSSLHQNIRLYTGDRRAGPIFERVSVRMLQRWFDQAVSAAGLEKKGGPHVARHTFATILRAKGFSLEEIQMMMGHSSRITTEIYAKLTFTPETPDRYLQLFEGGAYKQ
jgi:integrase/recombinase XerD